MMYVNITADQETIMHYHSLVSVLDTYNIIHTRDSRNINDIGQNKHNQLIMIGDMKSVSLSECIDFMIAIGMHHGQQLCIGQTIGLYDVMVPDCVDEKYESVDYGSNKFFNRDTAQMIFPMFEYSCVNRLRHHIANLLVNTKPDIILLPLS
jgi:hypothetical protein